MRKIKAAIIGASGYTGSELLRVLLNHDAVEPTCIYSRTHAGKAVRDVLLDLAPCANLKFATEVDTSCDVVFLCLEHGAASTFLANNKFGKGTKIIDLSHDHRFKAGSGFVYGLPELNRELVRTSSHVANPGCFATAIELALLPLAKAKMITGDVHVTAITGSTGAGVKLADTSHFSWRQNNVSLYKVFSHQHTMEIEKSLGLDGKKGALHFVPMRGPFTRGILASVYTEVDCSLSQAQDLYKDYYGKEPFTFVIDAPADIKQVVGTNNCFLHIQQNGKVLHITSVIDNLLKGAVSQAAQNMNIMFDMDETMGLRFKPSIF
ncbi:MAG: N-acetyl-gamma-glutamyl-phosphate reductase [Oligoflexales bacterium]